MIAVGFTRDHFFAEHPYRWSPCPEASASYVAARLDLEDVPATVVTGPSGGFLYRIGPRTMERLCVYEVHVPDLPHPQCCEIQQRWQK